MAKKLPLGPYPSVAAAAGALFDDPAVLAEIVSGDDAGKVGKKRELFAILAALSQVSERHFRERRAQLSDFPVLNPVASHNEELLHRNVAATMFRSGPTDGQPQERYPHDWHTRDFASAVDWLTRDTARRLLSDVKATFNSRTHRPWSVAPGH